MGDTPWSMFVFAFVTVSLAAPSIVALFVYLRQQRRRPDAYAVMEATLASQQRRMDDLERQRLSDHAMIIDLRLEMTGLREGIAILIRQLQDNKITPAWEPAAASKVMALPDRLALARTIAARFSLDEMDTLMFDIGIDSEELEGRTRQTRAQELVAHAERHGMLDVLAEHVGKLRPEK